MWSWGWRSSRIPSNENSTNCVLESLVPDEVRPKAWWKRRQSAQAICARHIKHKRESRHESALNAPWRVHLIPLVVNPLKCTFGGGVRPLWSSGLSMESACCIRLLMHLVTVDLRAPDLSSSSKRVYRTDCQKINSTPSPNQIQPALLIGASSAAHREHKGSHKPCGEARLGSVASLSGVLEPTSGLWDRQSKRPKRHLPDIILLLSRLLGPPRLCPDLKVSIRKSSASSGRLC